MANPFLNPEALDFAHGDLSATDVEKAKPEVILRRLDSLFAAACVLDAEQSGNLDVSSRKVVRPSRELSYGFSRMRLLPRVSDQPTSEDPSDVNRTFVKRPNNVLFGTAETYVFVPEQEWRDFRSPDIGTPLVVAFVTFCEKGGRNVYVANPWAVNEVPDLSAVQDAIDDGSILIALPGVPVLGEGLDRLQWTIEYSSVVDQDDREPLTNV